MASPSVAELLEAENRWAELENYTIIIAGERDDLKAEVHKLRKDAQILATESSCAKAAAVDHEELKKLRAGLSAEEKKVDQHRQELLEAREESAKVTAELQAKVSQIAQLTGELQEQQSRATTAELALAPVQAALETCKQEKSALEAKSSSLEAETAELTKQRNDAFAESSEQVKKLADDNLKLRQAAAEAQSLAKEAERLKAEAQEEVSKLTLRLEEITSTYDDEKLASESYREVRDEEGNLLTKRLDEGQQRMRTLLADLEAFKQDKLALEGEVKSLKQQLTAAQEASKAAGAAPGNPEATTASMGSIDAAGVLATGGPAVGEATIGLGSGALAFTPELPKLVQDLTTARQQALTERQARQQLEERLKDLEAELRVKLPLLVEQKQQLAALKSENAQLIQQSEEMQTALREAEQLSKKSLEAASKAKHSETLLEKHAREMAQQLGAVLQATQKGGASDSFVANLVEQNESLRKSVARLADDCETTAQAELKDLKQEHERLLVQWKTQLSEKDAQVAALSEQIRLLAQDKLGAEVSGSIASLSGESAGEPAAGAAAAGPGEAAGSSAQEGNPTSPLSPTGALPRAKELELQEQLKNVRNQFSHVVEVLHSEIRGLRESELKARRESAEARARLGAELSKGREAARNAARSVSRLKVQSLHLKAVEARGKSVQQRLRTDEEELRKLEVELSQAQRERINAEKKLQQEQKKVSSLEESSTKLLEERASYTQVLLELQMRIAEQSADYRQAKTALEEGFKKKAEQMQEEVEISVRQQAGLRKSVEELSEALAGRSTEVEEARRRISELEDAAKRSQEQITELQAEAQELRATGAVRPKREADVAATVAARAKKRTHEEISGGPGAEQGSRAALLEKQLKAIKQQYADQRQNVELWKAMLATHEEEAKKQQLEVKSHVDELEKQKEEYNKIKGELEKAKEEAEKQEEKWKEAKGETAKLEQSLKESRTEVQELEQKAKEAQRPDSADEWRHKQREAVKEIADIAAKLEAASEQNQALEYEKADLEQQKLELQTKLEEALSASRPTQSAATSAAAPEPVLGSAAPAGSAEEVSVRVRRLEAEKALLEAEGRTLRSDQRRLQEQLTAQSRELLEAKKGLQRGQQALVRLARLEAAEASNLRLQAELSTLQAPPGKAPANPTAKPGHPQPAAPAASPTAPPSETPTAHHPPTAPGTSSGSGPPGSDKDRTRLAMENALDLHQRLVSRFAKDGEGSGPGRDADMLLESKNSLDSLLSSLRQAESIKKLHLRRIEQMEKEMSKDK